MKRSKKNRLTCLFSLLFIFSFSSRTMGQRQFFQVTIYHYTSTQQGMRIDSFLQRTWLPAVHRAGINNVGIFSSITNDTAADKKMFVLLPGANSQELIDLAETLSKDKSFVDPANTYINAVYSDPSYTRMETMICRAFELAPSLSLPKLKGPREERIYEFRSYESPTEKLYRNKVQMFNAGDEIGLFSRLNFNAIFYAEVLAGSHMPNLVYMTSFENIADRESHWKAFVDDPQWKSLSTDPQYQHNVSKADIFLLRATSYSDY